MPTATAQKALKDVRAIKRRLAAQLSTRLKQRGGNVSSLARELGTSRTAVQRVLDPKNTSITLHTMVNAASSLGYKLSLTMEPRIKSIERVEAPASSITLMAELGDAVDRLPAH